MSARDIVQKAGMSARPEFYSGRGAVSCDLNSFILEKIYLGIVAEHGQKAGENFVKMVADIPKLSATDFFNTLYTLENLGWVWKNKYRPTTNLGIEVAKNSEGDYDLVHGLTSVCTFLSSDVNETNSIRNSFLRAHPLKGARQKLEARIGWNGNYC